MTEMKLNIHIEVPPNEQLLFFIDGKRFFAEKMDDTHYKFQIETGRFPVTLTVRRKTKYDTNRWALELINPFVLLGYACFKRKNGEADAFSCECPSFSIALNNPQKHSALYFVLEKKFSNKKLFGTYFVFRMERCSRIDLIPKEFSDNRNRRKWIFVRIFPPALWLIAIALQICLGRCDWKILSVGGALLIAWMVNFRSTIRKSRNQYGPKWENYNTPSEP